MYMYLFQSRLKYFCFKYAYEWYISRIADIFKLFLVQLQKDIFYLMHVQVLCIFASF